MWKKKIKRLRKSGLTQAEIADAVGVTQPYISLMEAGLKKCPSYTLGMKIDAQVALLDQRK